MIHDPAGLWKASEAIDAIEGTPMSDDPTDELLRILRDVCRDAPTFALFACIDVLIKEVESRETPTIEPTGLEKTE